MFTRLLMAGLLFCLVIGCAKKPKITGKADDVTPAKPLTSAEKAKQTEKDKGPQGDKPNWLTDPRFKKDPQAPPEIDPVTGKPPGLGVALPPIPMENPKKE